MSQLMNGIFLNGFKDRDSDLDEKNPFKDDDDQDFGSRSQQDPEEQSPDENDFLTRFRLNPKNVFNRLSTKQQPETKKVRSKVWNHVVTIVLIEGVDLLPKADNTLPDPFVKFKLGSERCKSKSKAKTLTPRWLEQFTLYMFVDQSTLLEISVRDTEMGGRENVLGSAVIDLDTLEKEKTHTLTLNLEDDSGVLHLLITICTTAGDVISSSSPSSSPDLPQDHRQQQQSLMELALQKKQMHSQMSAKYKLVKSFKNIRDVGWLQVKVLKAHGLAAADMGGKSDPFCVLELVNARLQTQTVYKCLTPEWNKTFTFNVQDIHEILEVTIYDENTDKKMDFLGKVVIPLLKVRPGERRWYQLKDAKLATRGKGVIQLEIDFVYNTLKAAIRTFNPKEIKYTSPEPKFRVSIMKKNIDRVTKIAQAAMDTGRFIRSCFDWESKLRSIVAFAVFLMVTIYLELYMLPAIIAIIFLKNLLILNIVEGFKMEKDEESLEVDCDDEEELEKAEKSKGFVEKLHSIQEVCLQVQQGMDQVATLCERINNALTWKVQWVSWLALTVLTIASIVLYLVPLRYLVLVWGINKFTKKLRNPNYIDNNELLDYLSRVPSDKELSQYRELRPEAGVQAAIRKKQQ